jgi:alpha-ketoglutarate-dependent taurine dioxygenase
VEAGVTHFTTITLPGQITCSDRVFPLALAPAGTAESVEAACAQVQAEKNELLTLARDHGAILIRGLPLRTDLDFDAFVKAFDLANFPYEKSLSNAVRINRTERVFTANEAPPETFIPLHHEMAQTPLYPDRLFFFCEKAAESGGTTPVCHSGILWEKLESERPDFAEACATHGLKYTHVMPPENDAASGLGRSWRSTFGVENHEDAEARMSGLGYSWEWLDKECLRTTTPVLPAMLEIPSPDGTIETFFNQLIAAFYGWKDSRNDSSRAITLGNGDLIDPADIHAATELAESCTVDIPWQNGDVALVDNRIAMHGRKPFRGTRKVLASLS